MSSKPPLGSGLRSLCAAELGIVDPIPAKVVFTGRCIKCRLELAASYDGTVGMQAFIRKLPERHRHTCTVVSSDVDVFYFLALASPNIVNDIEVLEGSTQVVSEIDAVSRVVACCSPVGGVSL